MNKRIIFLIASSFIIAVSLYSTLPAYAWQPQITVKKSGLSTTPVFFDKILGFLGLGKKGAVRKMQQSKYFIHDEKSFEENTRKVHMRPYNNPVLDFSISIPKNWEEENLAQRKSLDEKSNIIDEVAKFSSEMINVYRAHVTIFVQTLEYETDARYWLKNFLVANGYTLQENIISHDPRSASAYFTSVSIDGQDLHSYITVNFTGNIALIAKFDAPLVARNYLHFIQKQTIDSLALSYPRKNPVETQKTFVLLDALRFEHPVSWIVLPPDYRNMERFSTYLQNKDAEGNIQGFISIAAVRQNETTSVKKELERLKNYFKDNIGLSIDALIKTKPLEANPRFFFSRYETYQASYDNERFASPDVHFVFLADKSWYVFVYLITPKEQENLLNWARNTRSFDLIVESMR